MSSVRAQCWGTWALQASGHHLLYVTAIQVGLHDAVQRHIGPEHQLLVVVEVQGDGVLQVVQQQRVLRAVRQNLADVDAIGKQQNRFRTWMRLGKEGWGVRRGLRGYIRDKTAD